MFDGLGSTGVGCMTEEEQKLYDVIANWWDEIFTEPTKGRSACIIDLVRDIMDLKYNNVPENADPYNLRGRLPMQPVRKQND